MLFIFKRRLSLMLGSAFLVAILLQPLVTSAANLLTNNGLNNPYNAIPGRVWRGQSEQIANSWMPFYIPGSTYDGDDDASKLRWMSSAQFAAAFGGIDYKIEGDQSQNIWSSYAFDGGVYQQISATPGQSYGFDIAMVTFWRGPGYPDSNGLMVKQVGIDPYGGTDPASGNIIWSNTDSNDKAWVYMDVAATAQASTITVFAKVQAPENDSVNHTDLDMVYFDAAHVDLAPVAALNAANSGTTINANWSGNAASGWSIKGYEVQYKEQNAAQWTTLQTKNQNTTHGTFNGQVGHTYQIRVRPWQTMAESYNSDIDLPGIWVEQSVTIGDAIIGRVFNHMGIGLNSLTVSIEGTANSTSASGNGNYILPTGGAGTFGIVANNIIGLVAPPPISVTIPGNGLGVADIMLRPDGANQAVDNNDFEINLDSWIVSGSGTISSVEAHSGQSSLAITDDANVSQTGTATAMDRPFLSLWYKSNASLTVEFLDGTGPIQTKTLIPVADWTHTTLASGLDDAHSGPVGVRFSYAGDPANIYIDEVSIAEGPLRISLPVVIKN